MSENEVEEKNRFDEFMEEELSLNDDELLNSTLKLRIGLIKDNIKYASDPKVLGKIESLASGIDRQILTKKRLTQDKDDTDTNRLIAQELFKELLSKNINVPTSNGVSPKIENSGLEVLDGEIIIGDDIDNSELS